RDATRDDGDHKRPTQSTSSRHRRSTRAYREQEQGRRSNRIHLALEPRRATAGYSRDSDDAAGRVHHRRRSSAMNRECRAGQHGGADDGEEYVRRYGLGRTIPEVAGGPDSEQLQRAQRTKEVAQLVAVLEGGAVPGSEELSAGHERG